MFGSSMFEDSEVDAMLQSVDAEQQGSEGKASDALL